MLRHVSQSWINVGINLTRAAFWPTVSDSWSLFFSSQSPLLWSVCILAGYQSGVVSPSAVFPERQGVPPPLDQRVLDQRTPTLGGSSVPWIPWNMEELPRPWGEHGKEKKDPTYRRGKRYLRQKITSLLWLHTDGHKHACTPLPTGYNLYVLWALIQEGKALARYPCVHVRKSEFPGMLF